MTAWYRASSLGVDGDTGADGGEPSPDTGSCAAASASAGACDEACGDSCAANATADGEAFQFPFPVLSERHRLALRVRQPRGGVAAMPMDPAVTVFTTEGHLLPLRSGAAGVCGAEGPFEAWKVRLAPAGSRCEHARSRRGAHSRHWMVVVVAPARRTRCARFTRVAATAGHRTATTRTH